MNYDAQVYRTAVDLGLVDDIQPNTISTSVNIIPDNVYLGGDIHTFEANIIGTKSFLDDLKPFTVSDTTPVNGVMTSSIDLKTLFFGVEKSSFPATTTVLERSTNVSGEVLTKTATKINYPDNTYTNVTMLERILADATRVYEITTTTPILTNSGIKVFENTSTVTQNSSGQITNAIANPSIIKTVDSSGYRSFYAKF